MFEILCYLWQSERAVEGVSDFRWLELLRYYAGERVNALDEFLGRIEQRLGPGQILGSSAAMGSLALSCARMARNLSVSL